MIYFRCINRELQFLVGKNKSSHYIKVITFSVTQPLFLHSGALVKEWHFYPILFS